MSTHEIPNELSEEQQARQVAGKIAAVLLKPESQLLLDTVYEGSSFTPVIGEAVGIVRTGDTADSLHELDPVRKALQILRHEGGLAFERHDMETPEAADDSAQLGTVSAIEIVVQRDKMERFAAKHPVSQE